MKRDLTQAELPPSIRTSWPALDIPAMQAFPQENTTLPTYSGYALMDMPRPPGNYSGVDTSDCPEAAELFQDGTVPDDEAIHTDLCLFCIKNKLADALSYLYVKSDFEWLTTGPDKDNKDMVSFVCKWAATIDFEMKLNFTEIKHDKDAQAISELLISKSFMTCLTIKFKYCPLASEVNLLSSLNRNTRLSTLEVINISDDGIKMLDSALQWNSTIKNLGIYKISMAEEIAIPFFYHISENTNLKSLKIGVKADTSHLIPILSQAITQNTCLASLQLEFSEWFEESANVFAAALGKNEHLSSVCIDSIHTSNGFHQGRVKPCEFDRNAASILLKELKSNTTLKLLEFNCCKFGDQISGALKELISANKTLTILKLYNCDLGSQSAKAIAEALPINTTLRSLDIGGNRNFKADDWSLIIKSCKTQCPLTTLKLCRVSQGTVSFFGQLDFPVADLVEMIQSNTTLAILDLSCYSGELESFTIDQLLQISAALDSNHTLMDFILHHENQLMARKKELAAALDDPDHTTYIPEYDHQVRISLKLESAPAPLYFNEIPHYLTKQSASNISRFQQYDFECNKIAGKVGANAIAQRLRLGAMQGWGATHAPYLPAENTPLSLTT